MEPGLEPEPDAPRYVGEVSTANLPPIPTLRLLKEVTLPEALALGQLDLNQEMAKYALEQIEEFMIRNPGWNKNRDGALCLYTLEFPSRERSFYFIVNGLLRDKDRKRIKRHLPVLKLMSLAIAQLPA